jgi:hypothetical protein
MKPLIKLKTTSLLVIPLVLAGFALLPRAQAETISPAVFAELPGFNTAAGFNALDSLTTGTFNSGFGALTLEDTTSGSHNTALGGQALRLNTIGSFNTAVGENALVFNTSGGQNMALGQGALAKNLTGSNNTAMGFQALNRNTVSGNTAIGFQAGFANSTGTDKVAVGFQALASNTMGNENTAIGSQALVSNTEGAGNTAVGTFALFDNMTGSQNTAIGENALGNITGVNSSNNIALGAAAGANITTGNFNIDIGNVGPIGAEFATIRIGQQGLQSKTFIAGITGVNQGSPTAVFINTATGQLGTTPPASSRRFKKEIKTMEQASASILSLKPVTFHYKSDTKDTPQFGLIAEEVAAVNPDLVVRDENGEIYSVRYDAVNAMLLNEFLKEHHQVQGLKAIVAEQQKQIEALTAGLHKVNNQLELSKPASQMVGNNR